jgi:GPH family glycoside/pentoside/hexuronide:cation symporter
MIDKDIHQLAVERFKTLDIETDEEFQELIQMASDTCETPIALITLVDKDTQWLKVRKGTDVKEMPFEMSFCKYTIQEEGVLVVPDAKEDVRFADNPLVTQDPNVRFYAGAPLITRDGQKIGSLCVIDVNTHVLNKQQELMLKTLSRQAINLMEFRISVEMLESNKLEFEKQKEIIRKAEISQRSFFESAPNFHVLLGKNGEVIDFNKVAFNFIKTFHQTNLTRGEILIKYIAPDFVNKFIRGFKLALLGKQVSEEGSTDYGQHGIIYWDASFETARDADNEIIGVSYIIRDVTDRKVKEQKILAQNQSLLKIAHLQAHEFRAPLTTIIGMMDLIRAEDYRAPQEYYELLDNAVQNLDLKIRSIVNDIVNIVPSVAFSALKFQNRPYRLFKQKIFASCGMPAEKLPLNKQLAYASGMIGWSIMTNIIFVMLPYFYLPPSNSMLIPLVPQLLVFGVVNIMSLITVSGRLFDAVYDPFIASRSDRSENRGGRRIPFMKWAILPAVVFCGLTFSPLVKGVSINNAVWITFTLIFFFLAATTYAIPYNALLPELTENSAQKVRLSSFQQAGFVIGIIISALVNNFADLMQHFFNIASRDTAIQYTIWVLCIFAGLIMLIPVIAISEEKFAVSRPSHLPLLVALRKTFSQRNFKYFLISDFSFYMSLSIISSGLLFFVTVLLRLPASIGGLLMAVMVLVSLLFYPLINYLAKRFGKKRIILFSFAIMGLIFMAIYFLGRFKISPELQIYALVLCASFPLASLGILPNAIIAEIAEKDADDTGENREGMFYAVRYLFVKLGQTLGIALFTFLTIYGEDPGNDYGLRLNGVCGFALCLLAIIFFSRFHEQKQQAR